MGGTPTKSQRPDEHARQSLTGLIGAFVLLIVLGGAGVTYIWSAVNAFEHGVASLAWVISALVVALLVLALIGGVYRFVRRFVR